MTIHPAIKATSTAWQAGTADDDGYGFELCSRHSLSKSGEAAAKRAAKGHAALLARQCGASVGALVVVSS